jgi:hypothetical protein
MTDTPPPPAGRQKAADPVTTADRWVWWRIALLLVLLAASGWIAYQLLHRLNTPQGPPVIDTSNLPMPTALADPDAVGLDIVHSGPRSPDEIVAAAAGREPLDTEPAGIQPPPGHRRPVRFLDRTGGSPTQYSLCRIPGAALHDVADHYRQQATAAGFVARPAPTHAVAADAGPADLQTLIFTDASDRARLLSITLRQAGDDVSATVILQYPDASARPQPARP